MHPELLVEIALTRSGAIPEDLIVRTYAASRFEPIALMLNGITARLVNAVLDPVVPTMPLDIPGVLYVDISNGRVWEMLQAARLVFASTPALRDTAIASGVSKSRIRQAESAFLIPAEIKPGRQGSKVGPESRYRADSTRRHVRDRPETPFTAEARNSARNGNSQDRTMTGIGKHLYRSAAAQAASPAGVQESVFALENHVEPSASVFPGVSSGNRTRRKQAVPLWQLWQ